MEQKFRLLPQALALLLVFCLGDLQTRIIAAEVSLCSALAQADESILDDTGSADRGKNAANLDQNIRVRAGDFFFADCVC